MKFTLAFGAALALASSALAQNTTASLLSICGAQRTACSGAAGANMAFCASQYFGCISPNNNCGCNDASSACLTSPPTGNIFDCAPALAACVVACSGNSTVAPTSTGTKYSTQVITITSCAASVTNCPARTTTSLIPIITNPVVYSTKTTPAQFTGAAAKVVAPLAGVAMFGAALLF